MDESTLTGEITYETWFRSCFPRAVGICCRVVGPDVAEDAALEAFVRAYVRWHRLRQNPSRDGWVLLTAYRNALGMLPKRSAQPVILGVEHSPEEGVVLRLGLLQALRRLPRRQKEAIVLRYLGDFTEQETAAALGISVGAVKSHVHRALNRMRTNLDLDGSGRGGGI